MTESNGPKDQGGSTMTRSRFIGTTAGAAAAFTIVPRNVLGGPGYQAPSDMVNVAGIGVGDRGGGVIRSIQSIERTVTVSARPNSYGGRPETTMDPPEPENRRNIANIYALCDVDEEFAGHMFAGYANAKQYKDYRRMIDREPEIDAVVIGTPDHNHAPIAAYAMKAGKHVYVEKPMCKTVFESRELRRIAAEMGVVTTMGNQGHASEGTRETVELIQSGAIGDIREVHAYTGAPSWPQGDIPRPEGVRVPRTLDWNLWLGPAPVKPYHPVICHFNWRGLRDYGTGAIGDWGSHTLDAPVWALKMGWPSKIQASSTAYNDEFWPLGEMVTLEFPAREGLPPCKLVWWDGRLKPPRPPELADGLRLDSVIYYGDKGMAVSGNRGSGSRLLPESAMEGFTRPEPWIPRGTGNIQEDWINAIKNGTKTSNDFSHSGNLGEIMALVDVAVLAQGYNMTLEYDGENMEFTNCPEANELLHYEYRQGWTL